MYNLLVELDERFASTVAHELHARISGAGFDTFIRSSADGRTLAWIDATFGGTWSNEAFHGRNIIVSRDGAPVGFATIEPQNAQFAWLRGEGAKPGTGIFGPFGVDPQYRNLSLVLRQAQDDNGSATLGMTNNATLGMTNNATLGMTILNLALCELRARGHERALIAAVGERLVAYYQRVAGTPVVEEFAPFDNVKKPPRAVVLASGSGTNAQAVIDAVAGGLPLSIEAVVTNRADAGVIERAERAHVPCDVVVWHRSQISREAYDALLLHAVRTHKPDLVLLLGWMHLLDERFVSAFPCMLNIHPAFLPHDARQDVVDLPDGSIIPAFRGAHAVRDAMAARVGWVGASLHTVTMETDRGGIVARRPLAVTPGESIDGVFARLHPIEHEVVVSGLKRWLYERS